MLHLRLLSPPPAANHKSQWEESYEEWSSRSVCLPQPKQNNTSLMCICSQQKRMVPSTLGKLFCCPLNYLKTLQVSMPRDQGGHLESLRTSQAPRHRRQRRVAVLFLSCSSERPATWQWILAQITSVADPFLGLLSPFVRGSDPKKARSPFLQAIYIHHLLA